MCKNCRFISYAAEERKEWIRNGLSMEEQLVEFRKLKEGFYRRTKKKGE